ncbi:zymogen granule protein 16 homolog B [Orycteropus afer afer]|uniref:Zymogen granule protein 16 homolog B n=1 Tax=Orycteropus afer afer TaxID=1230840 RepID=A0AC54Z9T0_ORYAF|nr:zymogen granule protein 16 homolog B [Orycteropus afer afer]
MLLALTLALLMSPACLAQEIQGRGGGFYFYVRGEEQGEIQAIRVFVGILGFIKGIQLRFGEHWSARYGAPGGRAQELLLQPGERVTAVSGSAGVCVRHLRWSTSRGRDVSFGSPAGRQFCSQAPAQGQQLLSANGQHGLLCLSGIGFKWGFAPKTPPTQGPTAETQTATTGAKRGPTQGGPPPA